MIDNTKNVDTITSQIEVAMDFFQGTTAYHKLSTSIRSQVVIYEINYTQVLHPILTVVLDYNIVNSESN